MRKYITRAVVAVATTAVALFCPGTASAEEEGWDTKIYDRFPTKLKASITYLDGIDHVCIRAHNSVREAYAEIWLYVNFDDEIRHFRDYGGDDEGSCRWIGSVPEGDVIDGRLRHVRSDNFITDEHTFADVV